MGEMKNLFISSYWRRECQAYDEMIQYDEKFNASFRGVAELSKSFKKSFEWKYIKAYRKWQCNRDNIWGKLYKNQLDRISKKTGIDFEYNSNIGKGLIIGHWGRIVINGEIKFGNELLFTHGVTIGRDIRGKRKGTPKIGNRVCIRTNSTVVGNITIGDDVLIAPNTFVNFDVPNHSIVIGNPAKIYHRDNATEGHLGVV